MRLTGAIKLVAGWHFDYLDVPGVLNDVADDSSRWNPGDICRQITALHSLYRLAGAGHGSRRRELCTSALAPNASAKPSRERRTALTNVIFGVGSGFVGSCFA